MDCGPTCLRMICTYYRRKVTIQTLRQLCAIDKTGVTLLDISEAAEKIGFRTTGVQLTLAQLKQAELPCILHWRQYHFVVLYQVKNGKYYLADPARGLIAVPESAFKKNWFGHKELHSGISLLLSPAKAFYLRGDEMQSALSWLSILQYFYTYRQLFLQLLFSLGIGTLLSLVTPLLTQSIVDIGITTRDISFVYLILFAQVMLFLGVTSVNFIRSWILLHISTRINISILTDFLIKLMKLPVSFFESKTTGDILQRMTDQQRIESFLTGTALTAIFSAVNLVVFTLVLEHYNGLIFWVSLICTALYIAWLMLFLERRRKLNYKQFDNSSNNQTNIVELINGIQEIKLNNSEQRKRWSWEHLQATLFKYKVETLTLTQYQQGGSMFINQAKNIIITFLSVKAVIGGQLTIGGMMAVQYIVGQISAPVDQILTFIQGYQDAKIGLERLNEIHQLNDEEPADLQWLQEMPNNKSISIKDLNFTYPGAGNDPVLININLDIPQGKTTAVVGMSGSGKTTLLKLLLRFYKSVNGQICVGGDDFNEIAFKVWRASCGTVMQDGFIFSDTIENNICVSDEQPNEERLRKAIEVANIGNFIEQLPLGLYTKIGAAGNGLSQGQKQRLLIARAVYKNPDYLFFDEATNALDANNERIIMNNLSNFFHGKTVLVIAHRLSTVSNADNIVVMDKGRIIEQGTHEQLLGLKGDYYRLVKNQLELGI